MDILKFCVTRLFVCCYQKYTMDGGSCVVVHPAYMLQLFDNTVAVIIEL